MAHEGGTGSRNKNSCFCADCVAYISDEWTDASCPQSEDAVCLKSEAKSTNESEVQLSLFDTRSEAALSFTSDSTESQFARWEAAWAARETFLKVENWLDYQVDFRRKVEPIRGRGRVIRWWDEV